MNFCSWHSKVWYNHMLINYQFLSSFPFFSVPSPFMWACLPNDSSEIEIILKNRFYHLENNLMCKNNEYFRTLLPQFHYPLTWKLYKRCIHFLGEKSTISINLHYLKYRVYFEDMNLAHKRLSAKYVWFIIFGVIILCTIVQYYHSTLCGDFSSKDSSKFLSWGNKYLGSMMVISLFIGNSTQKDGMCYPWHKGFCWKFRENKMSSSFSDYRENTCGEERKQSSKKYVFIISVLVSWNSLSMRS